jgi:ABC-type glycerol-3-phosphate transport system substrate-binding protein
MSLKMKALALAAVSVLALTGCSAAAPVDDGKKDIKIWQGGQLPYQYMEKEY